MPIVVKRIRKYFSGRESQFVPALFDSEDGVDQTGSSELLRTIKLSKNVFKLSLPQPAYEGQAHNFQTIPGSTGLQ